MKNLIILFVFAIGSASCSSISDDYHEVDKGIVVCTDSLNSSIAIRRADSTFCAYSLKHRFDDMSLFAGEYTRKIKDNDTVYIYGKGVDFVATKLDVMQARKVNDFLNDYNFKRFYDWKNLLKLLGIFIVVTLVFSLLFGFCRNGMTESFIFLLCICWIISYAYYTHEIANIGIDHKLVPECSGKVVKIENNTVWLDENHVLRFTSAEDIMTNNTITSGQMVYAYRYVERLSNNGCKIFLSSKKLSQSTLENSNSYPNLFWKTCGFFAVLCVISTSFAYKINKKPKD